VGSHESAVAVLPLEDVLVIEQPLPALLLPLPFPLPQPHPHPHDPPQDPPQLQLFG
jgi:hypothetical protein